MNETFEHISLFLHAIIIRDSQSANKFLSRQSVPFQRDKIWVYGAAGAVNENFHVTDLSKVWDEALQLKSAPLDLSLFAELRAKVLTQGYTTLQSFLD